MFGIKNEFNKNKKVICSRCEKTTNDYVFAMVNNEKTYLCKECHNEIFKNNKTREYKG